METNEERSLVRIVPRSRIRFVLIFVSLPESQKEEGGRPLPTDSRYCSEHWPE